MTISEIAKLAGVSSAAVSRYLNDGSLSQEKRQRIERVIRETKYRPSEYSHFFMIGKILSLLIERFPCFSPMVIHTPFHAENLSSVFFCAPVLCFFL